ncbi:MAG: non-ribosomal peptide synthetase [Planctomycetia bacterium]|nr:non-ribosomal peptide synthetase [Planctomycetia bacterium]
MDRFVDIPTLLVTRGRTHATRSAIETPAGAVLTYAELAARVAVIATGLAAARIRSRRRRPRIAIVMPNGADLAVALLGVTAVGEAAPFNPASTASELDLYFRNTGVDAVLVRADANGAAVAVAEASGLPLLRLTPRLEIAGFEQPAAELPPAAADDIALVLLTSGSTGRPKIVPLTHRNVCVSAGDVSRSMQLTEHDCCLCMWEQYHVGGLVDLLLAPLSTGGQVIVTAGFDAADFFKLLHAKSPTWFQGVPTTLNELVLSARRTGVVTKASSLRLVRSVAAALPPTLMHELEASFGVPVIQTFGMTEAGPLITSTPLPPGERVPGSVGATCGPEIRIVPGAAPTPDGVPDGRLVGEVAIRGPNVFAGYENDAEANQKAFRDGWFLTGDMGFLDAAGNLHLTGRIKQLINRGGEKINPQEVDDAILCHPAVAEAATVAVPHKTLGEDVAAAVVLKSATTADDLRRFLETRIAAFKIPRQLLVLDRLPRNPVGKLDKIAISGVLAAACAETGHVAPRTRLEALIAGIWEQELGIPAVGVHDDFATIGGDSLSSVRILLAVEQAVGSRVPQAVFAHASTIATIAAKLGAAGVKAPGLDGQAIEAVLSTARTGTECLGSSPGEASMRLEKAASTGDLTSVHDSMSLYATPAELKQLLHDTRRTRPARSAPDVGLRDACKLWQQHARWRRDVLREITAAATADAWRRESLCRSVFHYSAAGRPEAKTLVVGFGGNYLRLMVPAHRILMHLDPQRVDLLLLADERRSLFVHGIDGIAGSLADLCDHVDRFASARGYARVVALGTSSGGPPAIYAAIRQGWDKAVAVGPGSPARHPDMAVALQSVVPLQATRPTEIVIVTSANVRDTDAAHQLRSLFPGIVLERDDRFDNHNLLHDLQRMGELRSFLTRAVHGPRGADHPGAARASARPAA